MAQLNALSGAQRAATAPMLGCMWRQTMPTGPKGQKRKADVIGNAVLPSTGK